MGHLKISKLFIALAILCAASAAYSEQAAISANEITGEWYALEIHPEQGRIETAFIINTDATFSGTLSINQEQVWNYAGNWTLDGNKITWHYTESSLVLLGEDRAEIDEILSVDRESMTYRSERHGTVSTLQRVR